MGLLSFFALTLGFIFMGYYRLANPVTNADSQLTSKKRLQRHYIQPAMVKIEIKTECLIKKGSIPLSAALEHRVCLHKHWKSSGRNQQQQCMLNLRIGHSGSLRFFDVGG